MIVHVPSIFARSPGTLLVTAAVAAALLASCRSAPTRIFTLEPIGAATAIGVYSGPPLHIDAVHIPPSLDRTEVTTAIAPGELRINDLDHWAAPLGQLARQALTADLIGRLPEGKVIFPHLAKANGAIGVNVDILAFSADANGARLEASWIITSNDSTPGSAGRAVFLNEHTGSESASATARAWSGLLARLADRISEDVINQMIR